MEVKKVKAKVVMMEMPHKNYSWSHVVLNDHGTIMSYRDKKTRFNDRQGWYPQYLYFTTNEEIKEDDWCYHIASKEIVKYPKGGFPKDHSKKIIATTDKSLNLPQPSQAFVKKYCELGGIDEVMLEIIKPTYEDWIKTAEAQPEYKFKTDSNNCIIIKPIKESWTREEVEDIHVAVMKQGCLFEGGEWSDEHERLVRLEFNKYAKQNL